MFTILSNDMLLFATTCVRDRETQKHILERERTRRREGRRASGCVQLDANDVKKDIQMMKGGERAKVSEGDRVWE